MSERYGLISIITFLLFHFMKLNFLFVSKDSRIKQAA